MDRRCPRRPAAPTYRRLTSADPIDRRAPLVARSDSDRPQPPVVTFVANNLLRPPLYVRGTRTRTHKLEPSKPRSLLQKTRNPSKGWTAIRAATTAAGDCSGATASLVYIQPQMPITPRKRQPKRVVQGQHRVVSPGDDTKTPHVATVFCSNPLPGIEWFTGGLGGARGRLGCVGLSSGGLNPVVSP